MSDNSFERSVGLGKREADEVVEVERVRDPTAPELDRVIECLVIGWRERALGRTPNG